ncbi:PPC domain-containing DNA-binding protein [Cupriavidus sp. IDO]|uniref:PPC domain-containing DNA-binding protein n=1 Tax=Cupriavidus sp. IDO TaxID=1539142 RepID=UPI0005799A8B|nr:PPC domain-containing DNA-binding protein [Cupriavidus sp. IDO]KWR88358.1 DNA-binding protein [Cupriavidus sp. IDO]
MTFIKRAVSLLTLGLTLAVVGTHGAAAAELKGKYMKTPTGYLMVLRHGDNVLQTLEQLARDEKIPSASFVGIGFMSEATFGFYDFNRKQFDPKTYRNVEMANMTGSIAWKEGKPSIHAHGTVTDGTFNGAGGHLLGLTVGTGSCEITVTVYPERLERFVDPEIQANVLGLPQK